MRLLADTHIAIWALDETERLSSRASELLSDDHNTVFVSLASLWEISIKRANRRGTPTAMPYSAEDAAVLFQKAGFRLLPIELRHFALVETMPQRHRDPFDRLLAAQAMTDGLHLITHDRILAAYSDNFVLV